MDSFLWELVPWGYQILLGIQEWRSPLLDSFFSAVTELGSENFYIILFALLYWCFSKQIGVGIAYAALFSAAINATIKDFFSIPRPASPALYNVLDDANIAERLTPLFEETSPSWPSNHSQGITVMWGYLAWQVRKGWLWVIAITLILLVAFSRMYGGVHFPQDVLSGLLFGVLFLLAWVPLEAKGRTALSDLSDGAKVGLALAVPLILLVLTGAEDATSSMGAAMGLGVGLVMEARTLRFSPAGPWWKRILRAVLGLVVVFAVYLGLSALFGLFDESVGRIPAMILRTFRYALVGFTGFYAAPWLFLRIGLVERES